MTDSEDQATILNGLTDIAEIHTRDIRLTFEYTNLRIFALEAAVQLQAGIGPDWKQFRAMIAKSEKRMAEIMRVLDPEGEATARKHMADLLNDMTRETAQDDAYTTANEFPETTDPAS